MLANVQAALPVRGREEVEIVGRRTLGRLSAFQVGLRTVGQKGEGHDSGTEPYDARVSRTVSLRRV
jgi:hypothetical protein